MFFVQLINVDWAEDARVTFICSRNLLKKPWYSLLPQYHLLIVCRRYTRHQASCKCDFQPSPVQEGGMLYTLEVLPRHIELNQKA